MKHIVQWIVFGIVLVGLAACSAPATEAARTSTATMTLRPPSATPAATEKPTAISSPTILPSFTVAPTETAMATLPVFSKEEVEANILQLFMGESNCELPCWWGLMPGKTTWTETKYFLASRGIKTDYYYRDIPWDIYSSANFLENYLTAVLFEFHVRQKIV